MEDFTAALPTGSASISLDPSQFIPGLPALPKPPSVGATSVALKVTQTCPGAPLCGKSKPCVISKQTPTLEIPLDINLHIPNMPSLPKIPTLNVSLSLPKIGFPATCPNAKKAGSTKGYNTYKNQGQTAPSNSVAADAANTTA